MVMLTTPKHVPLFPFSDLGVNVAFMVKGLSSSVCLHELIHHDTVASEV